MSVLGEWFEKEAIKECLRNVRVWVENGVLLAQNSNLTSNKESIYVEKIIVDQDRKKLIMHIRDPESAIWWECTADYRDVSYKESDYMKELIEKDLWGNGTS